MLMVCAYFIINAARDQSAAPILTSNVSKRVFLEILHSFGGLQKRYHNFREGVNSLKTAKNWPEQAFSSQNAKILQWQYLQNSKSNQVEI